MASNAALCAGPFTICNVADVSGVILASKLLYPVVGSSTKSQRTSMASCRHHEQKTYERLTMHLRDFQSKLNDHSRVVTRESTAVAPSKWNAGASDSNDECDCVVMNAGSTNSSLLTGAGGVCGPAYRLCDKRLTIIRLSIGLMQAAQAGDRRRTACQQLPASLTQSLWQSSRRPSQIQAARSRRTRLRPSSTPALTPQHPLRLLQLLPLLSLGLLSPQLVIPAASSLPSSNQPQPAQV